MPPYACHPVGRKKLNSSNFPGIQPGMSVLINDVIALLCVVQSNEEIKFILCLH
jgi:hypothetical protein